MKIKTKKVLAIISILAISATSLSSVYAEKKVWEITVTDKNGNEITSPVDITWDENFNGTANGIGTIEGVKVTAIVEPVLDMRISKSLIELGVISGKVGSGSLSIEVGSNSPSWVTVKAKSENGWLKHSWSGSTIINSTNDGSYKFSAISGGNSEATATFQNSAWIEVNTAEQEESIYLNSKAENLKETNGDIEFIVTATAQTSAEAGNYEDYITFSIIANF